MAGNYRSFYTTSRPGCPWRPPGVTGRRRSVQPGRLHTSQVTAWKKQLMAQVAELFADGRQRRTEEATDEEGFYEQIGRL